uniref:Uncharacterized protein n=1 Tax=Candidatus Kentrum sp. TUN TaxID=2126343 RepID=A0A450ZHS4_9GAMM|nr:MAG: hypothetical protein BECKTUN1418F_GA0071002_101314 [Candidatus Kentron sp. TUN]VFK53355.1 MAG: hypothetical protein BECKTUN1418E_GA0071001_101514 [Candidatus Kentron sp. TUN]
MFKKAIISMLFAIGIFFAGMSSAAVMPNETQTMTPAFALGSEVPIDVAMETRGEWKIPGWGWLINKVEEMLVKAGIDATLDWLADMDIPTSVLQVILIAFTPQTACAPDVDGICE